MFKRLFYEVTIVLKVFSKQIRGRIYLFRLQIIQTTGDRSYIMDTSPFIFIFMAVL